MREEQSENLELKAINMRRVEAVYEKIRNVWGEYLRVLEGY